MQKMRLSLIIGLMLLIFSHLQAADLSGRYHPILQNGILWEERFSYLDIDENGLHGSPLYNEFNSHLHYPSLDSKLRFFVAERAEFEVDLDHSLPTQFKRFTFSPQGALSVVQRYKINYFRDYSFGMRLRKNPFEIAASFLETSQKTDWTSAPYPGDADYFSYIRAHFEDFTIGARYLTLEKEKEELSGLSNFTQPLLDAQQVNIETQLEYRNGVMRRNTPYYGGASFVYLNYYHHLEPHYTPRLIARYGLRDNLEVESGISYTSPFNYSFEFKQQAAAGVSRLYAEYKIDNNFQFPLRLRYRPLKNGEVSMFCNFSLLNQDLTYWTMATTGVKTAYASRGLAYTNATPGLSLSYLYDNKKAIEDDKLSGVTKRLLRQGQLFAEVTYYRDLTYLDKNTDNGPQNIIDPYNVFMYPLDYFVVGTEYGAYFTGNSSSQAAGVSPQNFHFCQMGLNYGLTDKINVGCKVGYRSGNHLHHFVLGDPASASYLRSRFFKFKPFYFFEFATDARLTRNSIFSLNWYFVPEYTTLLQIDGRPKEFKSEDKYFSLQASLKILF
ncbi:MAG: hypothetical protein NT066_04660 [Candidatus Omnitrophica bacterium]|nr:hypothetical protein [Candidatus Omnitrophota bacterium]